MCVVNKKDNFTWLVLTATSFRASKSIIGTELQREETGSKHFM